LRGLLDEDSVDVDEVKNALRRLIDVMSNCQGVVADGSRRVGTIVKRLRAFAHLDEAEIQRVDLHANLEDTIAMYRSRLNPGVRVERDYADLPPVTCYPANINQLFLQLLRNANRACRDGGTISVVTRLEGGSVSVSVKDTGRGIAVGDIGKVFDPGFTAWDVGVGAGLGLSICYQIAKDHRGDITVDSALGRGSVFVFTLPVEGPDS
jgi:signal transduction histidine kinase